MLNICYFSEEIHGNDENDENLKQIVSDSQSNAPRSVSFMLKRWKSVSRKEETFHRELPKSLETLGIKDILHYYTNNQTVKNIY